MGEWVDTHLLYPFRSIFSLVFKDDLGYDMNGRSQERLLLEVYF